MEFNALEVVLLLFTAIGPLKATIVCASLTDGASPEFCRKVALRSVLIASTICIVFAVFGEVILRVFKVSIPAFQIGGGIIVLLCSIDMVVGKNGDEKGADGLEKKKSEPNLNIATYPLGIPLLASVSGLVAIVSLLAQRDDLKAVLFLTGVIVAIMAIDYFCLRVCNLIVTAVGPVFLQVVGKLMGVILTALAVELILMGLIGLGIVAKPPARKGDEAPPPGVVTISSQNLPHSTCSAYGFRRGASELLCRRMRIGSADFSRSRPELGAMRLSVKPIVLLPEADASQHSELPPDRQGRAESRKLSRLKRWCCRPLALVGPPFGTSTLPDHGQALGRRAAQPASPAIVSAHLAERPRLDSPQTTGAGGGHAFAARPVQAA